MLVITGASCLGKLLKVNHSLQELYMKDNAIKDKGISSVAGELQCNKTLTKLYVGRCGFSVKGTAVQLYIRQIIEFKIIICFAAF